MRTIVCLAVAVSAAVAQGNQAALLVEAESFEVTGGWVVDQQFMDQMGSPFLLAHGMGVPVEDARTSVNAPTAGTYHVWVRTRDWAAPAPGNPGRFQLVINRKPLTTAFGTEGGAWHWQDGGAVRLSRGSNSLVLHDLTGFEGRCDAIVFAADPAFRPPDGKAELASFRKTAARAPAVPENGGQFDLVVVGGGMAGSTTAVAAARLGLKVALIQDRPLLGGNTSSEIRVGLGGAINLPPYPAVGAIVAEMDPGRQGNAAPAAQYDDERKLGVVKAEKNIGLFLNRRATRVEMNGNRIVAVTARDVLTGKEYRYGAPLFADCTGDGNLGALAGADSRYGRESQAETGESMAPSKADNLVMGTSVMWYSENAGKPTTFPETPWALPFSEKTSQNATRGDWDWETGQNRHQIEDFEAIRDHAFRAIYGNWSFQKNHSASKSKYENLRLAWVAYVGGKRESRRLLGDVVLQEQDIVNNREFPDAAVTATWSIDLHVPTARQTEDFPGAEFRSVASFGKKKPYAIPYRCFYSRNIDNLFMAGRNISVTHVALGTVRVMRTTGMMGEVVGIAAALARMHDTTPRGVYQNHLDELRASLTRGVGKAALDAPVSNVPTGYELAWSDEFAGAALDRTRWTPSAGSTEGGTQLPRNVALRAGSAEITVERVSASGGFDYVGGGFRSNEVFGFGYYEARFRVLAGRGWLTTFSLAPDGQEQGLTMVKADSGSLKAVQAGSADVPVLPITDYHIYGCEVTAKSIRYYVDGRLVDESPAESNPNRWRILLSTVVKPPAEGDPVDNGRLPGHVEFDYVRYYKPGAR